jgi:Domain of unknown function (DUF3471)
MRLGTILCCSREGYGLLTRLKRLPFMNCRVAFCAALTAILASTGPSAQWLNQPTPGIPRTADGRPDLSAPVPRTSDGRPDLSGLWRPASFTYLANIMADMRPEEVPFQPWAAAVYEQRLAKDDPAVRCMPLGVPRHVNSMFKILQTSGLVVILYENHTLYRQIFTDGRAMPANPNPSWFGYSIGRWEGNAFIVESAGFNDKTWLDMYGHPHSESLHVIERFVRKDFGHMDVQVTIDDPATYTKPFTVTYPLAFAPNGDLLETICENNAQILPRLVGTDLAHPPRRTSITVDPALLSRYAGTYELAPGRNVVIAAAGDRLIMYYPGNPDALTMFAETANRFFTTVRDSVVEFHRNAEESITGLVIHTSVPDQVAVRKNP